VITLAFLLAILSILCACQRAPGGATPATAQDWTAGGEVDTTLSRTLTGAGVVLDYPADAVVVDDPDSNQIWHFGGRLIKGPIVGRNVPGIGLTNGHAYYLMVSTRGTATKTLRAWADSVRREWNNHEFDEDSLSFVYPAPDTVIAGVHARVLEPFCGDCIIRHYALKHGNTVVVLTLIRGGLEAWDRDSAEMMSRRIMATLRWTPTR